MGARRLAFLVAGATLLVLSLLLAARAPQIQIDNEIARWVSPSPEAEKRYKLFSTTFGSDQFVLVAYSGAPLFSTSALDAQDALLRALENIKGVRQIDGIPVLRRRLETEIEDAFNPLGGLDAHAATTGKEGLVPSPRTTVSGDGPIRVESGERVRGGGDLTVPRYLDDLLEQHLVTSPFYSGFLVSHDGETAALLVELDPAQQSVARRETVRAIEHESRLLEAAGFEVHLAGPPVLNLALDEASQRAFARTFPPALIASLILLGVLLRSLRATIVAAACAGLAVAATIGALAWLDRPLNMLTSALPALLWVLSLSNIIHVIRRYQDARQTAGCDDALATALRETALPCVLAAGTTAAGFLSLLTADMAPVRELGLAAASGMLLSLAINLLVGPLLIRMLRIPHKHTATPVLPLLPLRVARRSKTTLLVAGGLTVSLVALLPLLPVESDPLSFLPRDSATIRAYHAIAERLTGFYSLEVVVDTGSDWADPTVQASIEGFAAAIEETPGLAKILSPYALLASTDPTNGSSAALHRFLSDDGRRIRLSLLINEMNSRAFQEIQDAVSAALAALPAPMHGYSTGIVQQLVESQAQLVTTQLKSFALAFVVIMLCIGAGLRSWRLALLAIPPNLLPVLAAFGTMAVTGIALDAATVMIAAIALGIGVDDTVHLFAGFNRARKRQSSAHEALRETLSRTATPMVLTSATACAGFLALLRSEFTPIAAFGLVSAVAIAVALVADLTLTPALLLAVYGVPPDEHQQPATDPDRPALRSHVGSTLLARAARCARFQPPARNSTRA